MTKFYLAQPPCYDCNPCNDCDGNENNILNVNFAPINTNQQNWININTEIETDVNVNVSFIIKSFWQTWKSYAGLVIHFLLDWQGS